MEQALWSWGAREILNNVGPCPKAIILLRYVLVLLNQYCDTQLQLHVWERLRCRQALHSRPMKLNHEQCLHSVIWQASGHMCIYVLTDPAALACINVEALALWGSLAVVDKHGENNTFTSYTTSCAHVFSWMGHLRHVKQKQVEPSICRNSFLTMFTLV